MRWPSKPKFTIGLDSTPVLCGLSFSPFLPLCVIFLMSSNARRGLRRACLAVLIPMTTTQGFRGVSCCSYTVHGRTVRVGPLFRLRSYFQVVEVYNFDHLSIFSVYFIPIATPAGFLQVILFENALLGESALRWTKVVLHVQEKSLFAHLNLGHPLLRYLHRTKVKKMHIIDDKR